MPPCGGGMEISMSLIAHESLNHGIGRENSLMFRLPKDMKFFRETTTGATVIMGRKTLESFPGKKPLPNRTNIVISRNPELKIDGAIVCADEKAAAEAARCAGGEVYVIGGAAIYELMLEFCDTALITKVMEEVDADAFLHDFDSDPDWELCESSGDIEDNGHIIRFCKYRRKQ